MAPGKVHLVYYHVLYHINTSHISFHPPLPLFILPPTSVSSTSAVAPGKVHLVYYHVLYLIHTSHIYLFSFSTCPFLFSVSSTSAVTSGKVHLVYYNVFVTYTPLIQVHPSPTSFTFQFPEKVQLLLVWPTKYLVLCYMHAHL